MWRTKMQEVNIEPVNLRRVLCEAIEQRFTTAPIVLFSPIAADLLDPFQRRALAPVIDQFGFRPACPAQSRSEIVEHIVADRDAKGLDGGAHGIPFDTRRWRVKSYPIPQRASASHYSRNASPPCSERRSAR